MKQSLLLLSGYAGKSATTLLILWVAGWPGLA